DPQKVPVTVLSRCLQFNLRPMAPETVASHLQQVLQAESVPADVASLRLLARAARGSMRDALSLTDQAIAFGGGHLQEAGVRQMLGAVDSAPVLGLIGALAEADGAAVVATIDALRTQGLSAAGTLEDMTSVLQRMAVLQAVPDATPSDDPDAPEVARLAQALPPDETHLLYSLCLHGRTELGLAPDEYAALTMILLRLLAFKPSGTAEKKSLKTPEAAPPQARPAPLPVATVTPPPPPPVTPPPPAPAPVSVPVPAPAPAPAPAAAVQDDGPPPDDAPWPEPDDEGPPWEPDLPASAARPPAPSAPLGAAPARPPLMRIPVRDPGEPGRLDQPRAAAPEAPLQITPEGDVWFDLVMQLVRSEAVTALVRELALQSQLVARDEGQWVLRVERESLNQGNTRERLAAALQTIGHEVRLLVEIGPVVDAPARRLAAQARERQAEAEAQIMADPFVQTMMRDFGGRIVPGTLKAVS
ncbi:MAG: DNA polymerase III subunit gamma/tau, partial [Comamonadaceae bacterium]|nr:DNA polymerase III subunit gamma/tau [Comamonadaceae bacterium]